MSQLRTFIDLRILLRMNYSIIKKEKPTERVNVFNMENGITDTFGSVAKIE